MSSPIQGTLAKDRLGVASVIFFVMSAAAPLAVVAGIVTTGYALTHVIGIPLGFVAVALILAVFSVGYVAMSRHIINAGAFYTYVTAGLGRPLGVGAAWMALLAYNSMQVGLYGIIGGAVAPLLERYLDVRASWWVIALVAWALVAVMGVLRVDINGKVLALLLCAEILLILVYDVADLSQPAGGVLAVDALFPENLFVSGVGAVWVVTFLGFIGFESAVVFAEESRNPRRTIPLATYLSVAVIGAIHALSAWAISVATGPANVVAVSDKDGPRTIFNLAADRLPAVFVTIGGFLFATSVLAAMISYHNTVARYIFALARERVLPSPLSITGRRSGAPIAGSLSQSVVGFVGIVTYAILSLDPVVQLFFWAGNGGGFGIMLLVTMTAVAVLVFFLRQPHGESLASRVVSPLLSAAALVVVVYLAVSNFHRLLGVAADDPVRWVIPAAYPVVAVLGIAWAMLLRGTRPAVYRSIGLGANSVTRLTTQSRVLPAPDQPVAATLLVRSTGGR